MALKLWFKRLVRFDFKRWLAKINGYDLLGRDQHPSIQTHLSNLLKKLRIDVVLDVGANIGQYGALLRQEGYRGTIHSFEPVRSVFSKLSRAAEGDGAWFVHNMALGAKKGELSINVMDDSHFSSFLQPSEFADQAYVKETKVTVQELVTVGTVDDFFLENGAALQGKNILLKMDTQGFDHEVFQGALGSLGKIAALQSEISLIPIYAGMPHYLETLRVYEARGFKISGLYPICRKENLALIEMDCVMVNDGI